MLAYPAEKWVYEITRPYHLTVADIYQMVPGQSVELLSLDRNWGDFTLDRDDIPENVPMTPQDFFKHAYWIIFTKGESSLKGSAFYLCCDSEPRLDFEFDINYFGENWYPLADNKLLTNMCQNPKRSNYCWEFCHGCLACCQSGPKDYANIDVIAAIQQGLFGWTWQTRLGWRGPAIKKEDLSKLPLIFKPKPLLDL